MGGCFDSLIVTDSKDLAVAAVVKSAALGDGCFDKFRFCRSCRERCEE
jgi:hypothetical protein